MPLLKDVVKRSTNNAEAYRLVFQILAAAPSTFPDLVQQGLSLLPVYDPNAASSSKTAIPPMALGSSVGSSTSAPIPAPEADDAAAEIRARLNAIRFSQEDHRGRIKEQRRAELVTGQRRIPEEHPFHSTEHLKHRILRTLEIQRLIHKRFIPISPEYPKVSGESRYRWFLTRPEVEARHDKSQSFSIPEQWQRLFSGEHPGNTLQILQKAQKARELAQRERDLASHKIRRTEREIWVWEGRDPDMTTRLQKLHLNKRNRRRKVKDERELVARRKAKDEARAKAETEVRKAAAIEARGAAQEQREANGARTAQEQKEANRAAKQAKREQQRREREEENAVVA